MADTKEEKNSEHEGTLESKEQATTSKVKQEGNSEHEGTFENNEEMAKRKDITIPVFDGGNYSMWKKRIEMFLKFKECDVVIKREKTANDKED